MEALKPLKTYALDWDLTQLYKPANRAKDVEADVRKVERAMTAFAEKYRKDKRHLKDPKALLRALQESEKLSAMPEMARPYMYFAYVRELNSTDQEAEAMINKLTDRLTKVENKLVFFDLELGKISPALQKKFLKSKELTPYRYDLSQLFENSKYHLTEAEEKILNLKSQTSRSLWVQGFEKVLNKQTILWNGKEVPLPEASNLIRTLPLKERRELHSKMMAQLRGISDFAESEINAVVIDKKINDELRGFKHPYSATILGYENDEKSVLTLVKTVTDNFSIAHRFYKLKAQMLGLPKLTYADRSARVGKTEKKIPFKDAVEIVRSVFYGAHARYGEIFDRFLTNGQIDVFPKKGKSGGAFCSSSTNLPTFVLLNHVDDFHSASTLAHEMGHAIHSERSKQQPIRYQDYTTSVAETASTLFENILFNALFKELTPAEQIVALHDKLESDIASICRQIACFNFEAELHTSIREKGALSGGEIAALLNRHMAAYLGPAVELHENDGYFFANWSHIRNFFYVYSYAYGELISKALYEKYREDPSYIDAIDTFLSAGGSKKPEDIFKDIGIDTSKPAFFAAGMKSIERDVDRLEKLLAGRTI